jgi:hypothetical protein
MAYFYCDRNQTDRQNYEHILRSFVRQLSTPRDGDLIPSCIDDCYKVKEKSGFSSTRLTFQECTVLIRNLLQGYSKVLLVLDALDECDKSTRHLLIDELDKLISESSPCIIKILISSRPDKDIKHRFEGGPNVSIQATDNQEDIRTFLDDTINTSRPDWQHVVASDADLRDEIITTLHQKADGMYVFKFSPPTYNQPKY